MKRTNLIIIFLIFQHQLFAQNEGIFNFIFGNRYEEAEITYTNGSIQRGYINGFIENNFLNFSNDNPFDKFEEQLNLDDKKFYFKSDLKADAITLTQEQIKKVSLIQNNTTKDFYLLKIKSVDKNGDIVDLERKAWLPLLYSSSSINIYGFNLLINGQYIYTYSYFNIDDEYAIKATDQLIINNKKYLANYKIMLKFIFNNCDTMNPLIDDYLNKENYMKKYDELTEEIKKVKNIEGMSKDDKEYEIMVMKQNFYLEPLKQMIETFNDSCN